MLEESGVSFLQLAGSAIGIGKEGEAERPCRGIVGIAGEIRIVRYGRRGIEQVHAEQAIDPRRHVEYINRHVGELQKSAVRGR